jgi:hypothetical protein
MGKYEVPSNLAATLRSAAGREALNTMFEARLRGLHEQLEKSSDSVVIHRVQGMIAEVRTLSAAFKEKP